MELFWFLLIIWSATIIPFLILLGINLVRIWMQGQHDEMDRSSYPRRQGHMTDKPSFITGVVPWLGRSSVSIWSLDLAKSLESIRNFGKCAGDSAP